MIAEWIAYSWALGGLGLVGAFTVERLAVGMSKPRRWTWAATLGCCTIVPVVLAFRPSQPAPIAEASAGIAATSGLVPWARPSSNIVSSEARRWWTSDAVLITAWAVLSITLGLRTVTGVIRLRRSRRTWKAATLDGTSVLLSDDIGPAVVGLLKPKIVIPSWVNELPNADRRLLLLHELEHRRTGDIWLLLLGDLALIAMPWNPAVWIAKHRLRRSVEIDCDSRVLQRYRSVDRYGRLLLMVGERLITTPPTALGFARNRTGLSERIEILVTGRRIMSRASRIGAVGILAAIVLLAGVSPRPAPLLLATYARSNAELPINFRLESEVVWISNYIAAHQPDLRRLAVDAGISARNHAKWYLLLARDSEGRVILTEPHDRYPKARVNGFMTELEGVEVSPGDSYGLGDATIIGVTLSHPVTDRDGWLAGFSARVSNDRVPPAVDPKQQHAELVPRALYHEFYGYRPTRAELIQQDQQNDATIVANIDVVRNSGSRARVSWSR